MAARTRNTRQLRAILDVLDRANRPVSVEEIFGSAKMSEPGLGVATVYRAMKSLMEAGSVVSITLPGEGPRFESAGKGHHHHFRCSDCGRVFDNKACLGNLRRLVPRRFELTGHDLTLYGRCADCRA